MSDGKDAYEARKAEKIEWKDEQARRKAKEARLEHQSEIIINGLVDFFEGRAVVQQIGAQFHFVRKP